MGAPVKTDEEIVKSLKEREEEERVTKDQRELIELMTTNREGVQYKKALSKTIKAIRSGYISNEDRGVDNG